MAEDKLLFTDNVETLVEGVLLVSVLDNIGNVDEGSDITQFIYLL